MSRPKQKTGFWSRTNPLLDEGAFRRALDGLEADERDVLERLRDAVLSPDLDAEPPPSATRTPSAAFARLLQELDPGERDVILARHFRGMTWSDVASVRDESVRAAWLRYARARERLRLLGWRPERD
jgi:DNA-directed RNA polymerase specialized sigma24 family protein